ncbi:MAG: patatin-like phospholipase family protein [Deltaproteobacteria bacterium]|nr:patatin-like phospholipase family protein [Deltaproteobacteria bacterium]
MQKEKITTPVTKNIKYKPLKIGIALGGGGARGLAHLGVIKVLEEEAVPIHGITGVSIGAIVGAMYAQKPNADHLIKRIKESLNQELYNKLRLNYLKTNGASNGSFLHQATQNIKRRIVLNMAQNRKSLLKEVCLRDILTDFLDEGNIEGTKIPLGIVATSLHTGEDVIFRKGDIITAVVASASMPGFFCPACLNDDILTDGAVSCPVPVKPLHEMGSDVAIGVEVCTRAFHPMEALNVVEIIARTEMIQSRELSRLMVSTADVSVCPDTKDIKWTDFSRVDELIEAGIKSAREKMPDIKRAVQKKLPWHKRIFLHSNK